MRETMTAELLTCPHCNGEAWIIQSPISPRMAATCRSCGAIGGLRDTEAEAVQAWNQRNNASALLDEIEGLRELVWLYVDPFDVRPEHEALVNKCAKEALSQSPTKADAS